MTAGANRDPSPGELADDLAELKQMLHELTVKIDNLPYLRVDVYEARHTSLRGEVALQLAAMQTSINNAHSLAVAVDGRLTWVARAAVGGLLFPIIVAIVVGVLLAGGGT